MSALIALLKRDVTLGYARGAEALTAAAFFAMVALLFSFCLSDNAGVMQQAAPAVMWMTLVLAGILSLEPVWHRDFSDGTVDLLLMSPLPPATLVAAKTVSHWLVAGLPAVAASLVVMPAFGLDAAVLHAAAVSFALGSLYLSLLGGFGAVLTQGAKRPALLMIVIVLPLYLPMLICGLLCVQAALAHQPCASYLLLQLALLVAACPLAGGGGAAFLSLYQRSA